MINSAAITQWNNIVPWDDNAQVEQDLIISRALVAIFSDEFLASQLAFRGGTALHKLYLSPQPRYSEDIDLVQITPRPIKPIMFRLGEVLSFLPDRVTKQKRYNNHLPTSSSSTIWKKKCQTLISWVTLKILSVRTKNLIHNWGMNLFWKN